MLWFVLAFTSAFLSAAAAVLQKKVLFKLEALEFSFILSVLNVLIVLPFLMTFDLTAIAIDAIVILYGKTVLGSLAFLCVMLAIKNLEISRALPLMVLTPGSVAVSAFIILGESLSYSEIGGMLFLLAGTYVLERKDKNLFEPFKVFLKSRFHHFIIFAILLFTATNVIDRFLLRDDRLLPEAFLFFQQVFLLINFTVLVLVFGKQPVKIFGSVDKSLWIWLAVIALFTIGYRYTQIEAVKLAPVALVLSIKRISVFFAAVAGGKLFGEKDLIRKSIATAIMIAGALLLL